MGEDEKDWRCHPAGCVFLTSPRCRLILTWKWKYRLDEKHEVGDGSCFLEWPHSFNMHCLKSQVVVICIYIEIDWNLLVLARNMQFIEITWNYHTTYNKHTTMLINHASPKIGPSPQGKKNHPPYNHPTESDRSWQPPIRGGPRSPRRGSAQWESPISASAIFGTQVGFYNGLPDPQEKYDLLKQQKMHGSSRKWCWNKKHPTPTWRFVKVTIGTPRSWLRGLFAGKSLCKFHNEATASTVERLEDLWHSALIRYHWLCKIGGEWGPTK